jgi:hypothetical protein
VTTVFSLGFKEKSSSFTGVLFYLGFCSRFTPEAVRCTRKEDIPEQIIRMKWKAPEMGEILTCRRTCKVSVKSPPRDWTHEMDPTKRQNRIVREGNRKRYENGRKRKWLKVKRENRERQGKETKSNCKNERNQKNKQEMYK